PADVVAASTVTVDRTAPAATLTGPASPTSSNALTYILAFSEPITDLDASDLDVTGAAGGCTVGAPSGSGTSYTVTLTGCGEGTVVLSLAAGSVADLAGNPGPADAVAASTVTVDRAAPAATLTGPASPTSASALTYTLTFSEPITDLDASDLDVTGAAGGCTVGAPSGSGTSYTVTLTGCGEGTVVLSLAAGSAADLAGNPGPAFQAIALTVAVDHVP